MRYREIIEAPIGQFATAGDWDDPKGSFRRSNDADIEKSHLIIQNPKAVEKIRAKWARVPQKFNFWMLNSAKRIGGNDWRVYTVSDFLDSSVFAPYLDQIHPTSDAINVVFTTNFTTRNNYKPMTAWIMAHRLAHAFLFGSFKKDTNILDPFMEIEKDLAVLVVQTARAYDKSYKTKDVRGTVDIIDFRHDLYRLLAHALFTMRSARSNRLSNPLDFSAELFAQHILTGGIKINELPVSLHDTVSSNVMTISTEDRKKLDQQWQEFAVRTGQKYDQLLDSLVGYVLVL